MYVIFVLGNSQSVKTISTLKHLVSDRVALPTIGDGYHFRFQIGIVSTFQKFKSSIDSTIVRVCRNT